MFLALVMIAPLPVMAQVGADDRPGLPIGVPPPYGFETEPSVTDDRPGLPIGVPPPYGFETEPEVIVLPDTSNVYVVPGINIDLFFWNGWWWRPWQGRWYRSRYYNRGWAHYRSVPSFYYDVDPGWRGHYRDRSWYGHNWHYERIDQRRLRRNWQNWQNNQHWERKQTWGVQGYRPRPQQQRQELRRQRERQYRERPEVQRYHQQRQQQQRRPQVQQPKRPQPQERPEGVR